MNALLMLLLTKPNWKPEVKGIVEDNWVEKGGQWTRMRQI